MKNPMTDLAAFLTGDSGDYTALAAARYVVLVVFYLLAIGSLGLAVINLRDDRAQRSGRLAWLWLCRVLIGGLGFVAMLRTLPLGGDNKLHDWTTQMAARAAVPDIGRFASDVLLPHFGLFDGLAFVGTLVFATALLLGIFVRIASCGGLVVALVAWLGLYGEAAGDAAVWSWGPVMLALLCGICMVYAAGRALGADAWIRRNVASVRDRRGLGLLLRLLT